MALVDLLARLAFVLALELATLAVVLMWRARRVGEWKLSSNDACIVAAKAVGLGTGASILLVLVLTLAFGESPWYTRLGSLVGLVVIALALRRLLPTLASRTGVPITPYDARSVALSAIVFSMGLATIVGLVLIAVQSVK
jgi:hypothetical protein